MADSINKIQTSSGCVTFNYNALDNLPQSDTSLTKSGSFADSKAVGDRIETLTNEVKGSAYGTKISNLEDIVSKNALTTSTTVVSDISSQEKRIAAIEEITNNISDNSTKISNLENIISKNGLTASTTVKSSIDTLNTFAITAIAISETEFKEEILIDTEEG